jgi:hypothetical protein
MGALIMGLLLAFVLGALLIVALWPESAGGEGSLTLRVSLAAGLGLGFAGALFFVSMIATGFPGKWILGIESGALAVLAAFALAGGLGKKSADQKPIAIAITGEPPPIFALLALHLAIGLVVAFFVIESLRWPHGLWDAYSSWNLRARFILGFGEDWRRAFGPELTQTNSDYPPLLPSINARFWVLMNEWDTLGPIVTAGVFMLAGLGVLFGALAMLRGSFTGSVGALALAGTPFYAGNATWQYADVPLTFFFLSAVAPLAIQAERGEKSGGLAALAGLAASMAALTKNEGLLFLIVISASWLLLPIVRRDARGRWIERFTFIAGALPGFALLAYFKVQIAAENYLIGDQRFTETLARLADPGRYLEIAKAFVDQAQLMHLRGWGFFFIALPVYLLLVRRRGVPLGASGAFAFAVVFLMFLGYVAVYLITPYDLAWHLRTSLGRLLLHLWPLTIFFFTLAAPPEISKPLQMESGSPST